MGDRYAKALERALYNWYYCGDGAGLQHAQRRQQERDAAAGADRDTEGTAAAARECRRPQRRHCVFHRRGDADKLQAYTDR